MGGNSPSRVENERGRVHLTLEYDKVYPGEMLRGVASLTVKKPVDCAGVYASLSGEIKTDFQAEDNEDNHRYRDTEKAMETITTRLSASSVPGKEQSNEKLHLEPGQYEFPFEMAVPKRAPPSCEIRLSSISYTLEVSFLENGPPTKSSFLESAPPAKSKHDVYVDHQVRVLAKPLAEDPPCVLERSTTGSMCCCLMAGKLRWKVELDKTQFENPDDSVTVAVRVQNNTTRSLAGFMVELRMRTVVKADHVSRKNHVQGPRLSIPAHIEPGAEFSDTVVLPFQFLSLPSARPLTSCNTHLVRVEYEVAVMIRSNSWLADWGPVVMPVHAFGEPATATAAVSPSLGKAVEVAEEVVLAVPKFDAPAAYDSDEHDDDDDQPHVLKATIVDPNSPL